MTPAEKPAARDLVLGVLGASTSQSVRLVRVNGTGPSGTPTTSQPSPLPPWTASCCRRPRPTRSLPSQPRPRIPIVAIVETALGVREAFAIASHERVAALLLGAVDLGLALGHEPREDGLELLFARSSLVVDCAAAGLRAPIDRVWLDVRDLDGLARDCRVRRGRSGSAARH